MGLKTALTFTDKAQADYLAGLLKDVLTEALAEDRVRRAQQYSTTQITLKE